MEVLPSNVEDNTEERLLIEHSERSVVLKTWTQLEIEFLTQNYNKYSNQSLSILLNKSISAILSKASKLNLTQSKWSNEEKEYLRLHYSHKTNKQLGNILNRPPASIGIIARKMGLKKEAGLQYHNLEEYIIKLQEYAQQLGRTPLYVETEQFDWCIPTASLSRYIGGYREACKLANLQLNHGLFNEQKSFLYSKNNDLCWSQGEVAITNYFIDNQITYFREVRYSDFINDIRCHTKTSDWLIYDNVFVEYFGLMSKEFYRIKAEQKIQICQDNQIKLITLTEKDLKNLDLIFKNVFN